VGKERLNLLSHLSKRHVERQQLLQDGLLGQDALKVILHLLVGLGLVPEALLQEFVDQRADEHGLGAS
jgi:hypothetical protein